MKLVFYKTFRSIILEIAKISILLFIQIIFSSPSLKILNFCFIYLGIFSFITIKKDKLIRQLIIAFLIGLFLDIMTNSNGIYAFSSTIMLYSKYMISKFLLPKVNFKRGIKISIKRIGLLNFILIIIIPILIHNLALLNLHILPIKIEMIPSLIYKIILSFILTSISIFILYFIYET